MTTVLENLCLELSNAMRGSHHQGKARSATEGFGHAFLAGWCIDNDIDHRLLDLTVEWKVVAHFRSYHHTMREEDIPTAKVTKADAITALGRVE